MTHVSVQAASNNVGSTSFRDFIREPFSKTRRARQFKKTVKEYCKLVRVSTDLPGRPYGSVLTFLFIAVNLN